MSDSPHVERLRKALPAVGLLAVTVLVLAVVDGLSRQAILEAKQRFDRAGLAELFAAVSYDNDLVLDSYLLRADGSQAELSNLPLLNLDRDRLAYRATRAGEPVAIAVPTTADDGFNGRVDLLVAVDMYGRIGAARVIEDIEGDGLYGVVDIIDSKWMNEFSGNSMRDILRLSWQPITAENEYDQFVGASITPKSVANQIYDALVFYQSNRIELMAGG